MITETKLGSNFSLEQFVISGYSLEQFVVSSYSKPYRLDRNRSGGGVIMYVREDIPGKELFKAKWLLCGCYHSPNQNDQYFFNHLDYALDKYIPNYDRFILIGDFNAEDSEPCLSEFLHDHNTENIVKEKKMF